MHNQDETPNPLLARLQALVGEWKMHASIGGHPTGVARATFHWLDEGAFLIQQADAGDPLPDAPAEWLANSPFPLTTIIGADDASETFCYAYADARGVCRVYTMSLERAQERGEAGTRVETRETAPIDRPGPANQRRRLQIPDQRIVLDPSHIPPLRHRYDDSVKNVRGGW